jgi:hypothetical protein
MQDKELARVERYLYSFRLPTDLDDKVSTKFLRRVARFFLLNGRLWRWQEHG